jgi:GH25 family lysozyme M1 (1,4-beta-N-acetylmuramidase)
VICSELISI